MFRLIWIGSVYTRYFLRRYMPTNVLHKILTNPYYQGTVTYDGTHESLVDAETWLRVQTNLAANNARGERPQKYDHYLKGTLYCACGAGS